jgi:hypothetical protein
MVYDSTHESGSERHLRTGMLEMLAPIVILYPRGGATKVLPEANDQPRYSVAGLNI